MPANATDGTLQEILGRSFMVDPQGRAYKALGFISGAVTPVSAVVPDHIGQMYFDTVTKFWYVAFGTTNTDWSTFAIDTLTEAELQFLDGLLATTAEVNRVADVSTRNVALNVSTAITELAHDGKNLIMGGAGAARTHTLPAATGSGARFRFYVGAVNASNHIIKVTGDDTMDGHIFVASDNAANAALAFETAADSDTITLNGTTSGGAAIGDWVELVDIATDQWAVSGMVTETGTEVTPFSAAV